MEHDSSSMCSQKPIPFILKAF